MSIRFDAGIAVAIGLTPGRVSHLLGDPYSHSAHVIQKLLKGIPKKSTKNELFRSWLLERYADELGEAQQLTGVMRGAERKMEEANKLEESLTKGDKSGNVAAMQRATFLRGTLFEVGFAMQNLMAEAEQHRRDDNAKALIECHISRLTLLFHVERIRFIEIQRVVRGIERLIDEHVTKGTISLEDSQCLRSEMLAAISGLKLYRFLYSRSSLTHAEVNKLCEEAENLCDSGNISKHSRIGLLTTLTSVYTHMGELDEARRVLSALTASSRPDDMGLLLLEARLLRAEGQLKASRRALNEVYSFCLRHGMLMMAVFAQKELAATLSDCFPDLPTGPRISRGHEFIPMTFCRD